MSFVQFQVILVCIHFHVWKAVKINIILCHLRRIFLLKQLDVKSIHKVWHSWHWNSSLIATTKPREYFLPLLPWGKFAWDLAELVSTAEEAMWQDWFATFPTPQVAKTFELTLMKWMVKCQISVLLLSLWIWGCLRSGYFTTAVTRGTDISDNFLWKSVIAELFW